jgi:TIGR02646 family protein
MRYVKKSASEPKCLAEYKKECKKNNVPKPFLYKDFNRSGDLRRILIAEQHDVCCYCQRHCKSYRTEHSYPENGPDAATSASLQLEYSNLFASCIDSIGNAPIDQYCDVAKGNNIIREFIKELDCQQHFRYNSIGEIIPNGGYGTWSDYEKAPSLTKDEKDACNAIRVLNLNHYSLVEARKNCLDVLLCLLDKKSKDEWIITINNWLQADVLPDFIELRLQYIQKYINAADTVSKSVSDTVIMQ